MLFTLLLALALPIPSSAAEDPFLWLEDVQSPRSLEWVGQHNAKTLDRLQSRQGYAPLEKEMREILDSDSRLPAITLAQGQVYTFWQDAQHPRGLWQRAGVESYRSGKPAWEVLLDLDKLNAAEGKNWVWKGADCLAPERRRCLLSLSLGGGDAVEVREFRTDTKAFVADGFLVPLAKNDVSWADESTLLVGTDFGPGSMSKAGYPLISKRWKRGTPLSQAEEVFRGQPEDMTVTSTVVSQPGWKPELRFRYLSFFETEAYLVGTNGDKLRIELPTDSVFEAVLGRFALFTLHSDLKTKARSYPMGSLVAFPLDKAAEGRAAQESLELVFAPEAKRFLSGVVRSGDRLLLNVLDDVRGKVLVASREGSSWTLREVPLGEGGMAEASSADAFSDSFLATYTDFLTPTTQLLGSSREGRASVLRSSPSFFRSEGLVAEQLRARSKDGTLVPYFLVRRQDRPLDGSLPTLLYGYGGFNLSMTPRYSAAMGKAWLEKGGAYVVANIRGGGEFGPAWHEAARKKNRQRAYEDFIAVAEDLIARKVTSPARLGIQGGSNGGLLVGAVMAQRPELFGAVVCQVPLLDMLRYHLLLAGSSWIDEYGSPEEPDMREYLLTYSPYQNLKPGVRYPEAFFLTSTHDDRVHPGHARKMAAKMESLGQNVFYFENTEGGHGGSATPEQQARVQALSYTYLWSKLAP